MKIDLLTVIIILAVAGLLIWMFTPCRVECGISPESYMSLPFAGGDIRTYAPDPHRIEDKLWRTMDEEDSSQGYNL